MKCISLCTNCWYIETFSQMYYLGTCDDVEMKCIGLFMCSHVIMTNLHYAMFNSK